MLRGALAVGAHYLSADGSSFAHGQVTGGLEFWHPDTVLMALFRTEAGLYVDVRLDLVDLQNGATLRVIRDKAPRSSGTCTRAISRSSRSASTVGAMVEQHRGRCVPQSLKDPITRATRRRWTRP